MAAGSGLRGAAAAVVVVLLVSGGETKMIVNPYRVTLPYTGVVRATCFLSSHLPVPCKLEISHGDKPLMEGWNVYKATKELGNIHCASAGMYCCRIQYPDNSVTGCQKNSTGHFINVNTINSCNSLLITPESNCTSRTRRHLAKHEQHLRDGKSDDERRHRHRHHDHCRQHHQQCKYSRFLPTV